MRNTKFKLEHMNRQEAEQDFDGMSYLGGQESDQHITT